MIALAEAVLAGPRPESIVVPLVPQPHRIVQRVAPGHRALACLGARLPVVHVVLLEDPRGAEDPHAGQANRLLDLWRGGLVHVDPGPDLCLVRSARMPDAEGP